MDTQRILTGIRQGVYRQIGAGSGRFVYDLDNGYVAKYARNRRGLAQNRSECRIASSDRSGMLAGILENTDDFRLVIMEKAERITDITEITSYYQVRNTHELLRLPQMRELYTQHHLLLHDLLRPVNWGRINGRPVIVDYGFTRSVKKKYYSLF